MLCSVRVIHTHTHTVKMIQRIFGNFMSTTGTKQFVRQLSNVLSAKESQQLQENALKENCILVDENDR